MFGRSLEDCNGDLKASFQQHQVYSIVKASFPCVGKLGGHLTVCGWLFVVTAFVKQRVSAVTSGWDEENPLLHWILMEIIARASQMDPSGGDWCVNGQDTTVWMDASSLTTGVIENSGSIAGDASWLQPVHEDRLKSARAWWGFEGHQPGAAMKARVIHLQKDSTCVHHWISDTLSGKTKVRTKAA